MYSQPHADPTLPNCTDFEFYCAASRTCLHNRKQCNGVRDCPDDSDELNCCEWTVDVHYCGGGNPSSIANEWCMSYHGSMDNSH